ncbi:MAG: RNA 2',3'-cyclic phosphodiesterase [Bacillota bacterium]
MRTFIAILLSPEIRKNLALLQDEVRGNRADVKWVEECNLHLTLQFLGDIDPQDINKIAGTAKEAVKGFSPFPMLVKGIGVFPEKGRPQVVWAGARSEVAEKIWLTLNRELARGGWVRPEQKFTAHITLGRVRDWDPRMEAVMQKLTGHHQENFGSLTVKRISLMESRLSRVGPSYAEIAEIPLGVEPSAKEL